MKSVHAFCSVPFQEAETGLSVEAGSLLEGLARHEKEASLESLSRLR